MIKKVTKYKRGDITTGPNDEYTCNDYNCEMVEDADGDYVLYEDYVKLLVYTCEIALKNMKMPGGF